MLLAQLEIKHASVPPAKPQIVQTEIRVCITSQSDWSLGVIVKLGIRQ